MQAIRVAQMSDLHYSPDNLVEADRCFTAAVTEAIERKVDAAIITGDSTDHALPAHSPALLALAKQVLRLANHCPVLMLQGTYSHEPIGLLRMFALLGAKFPVTIADRISSFGLSEAGFEPARPDVHYRLVVHALPTLNKADVATAAGVEVGSASALAGDLVAQVLQSWAPVNRQLRLRAIPSMVISHGTVLNCISEHGVPMAGMDHEFGLGALFAAEAEAVALGHIHKHQVWHNQLLDLRQLTAYAGSIGRFHHGEDGEKFWIEWSLAPGASSLQPHPTPSRRTVDIFFDGPPDLDVIRQAQCTGADVRVRYEVDAEYAGAVNRELIRATLAQVGARNVQIEGRTLIVERVRAAGISQAQDLGTKLAKWAEASGNGEVLADLQHALTRLMSGASTGELIAAIAQDVERGACPVPQATAATSHNAVAPGKPQLFEEEESTASLF